MSSRDVIALIGNIQERAHRFIQRELDARGLHGLTPSHGATLSALFRDDEMRMSELSERIRRDRSTVTTLVRKLEALGYVTREQDSSDGRVFRVRLTESGRALEPAFREISDEMLQRTYRGYGESEKAELIAHLERVVGNWEKG